MVLYGLLWQNIDLIGLVSSFLAVIDPNSFGLVVSQTSSVDIFVPHTFFVNSVTVFVC